MVKSTKSQGNETEPADSNCPSGRATCPINRRAWNVSHLTSAFSIFWCGKHTDSSKQTFKYLHGCFFLKHSFTDLFKTCLMSINYVPGTVLDHGYETVIKISKHPLLMEVTIYLIVSTRYFWVNMVACLHDLLPLSSKVPPKWQPSFINRRTENKRTENSREVTPTCWAAESTKGSDPWLRRAE